MVLQSSNQKVKYKKTKSRYRRPLTPGYRLRLKIGTVLPLSSSLRIIYLHSLILFMPKLCSDTRNSTTANFLRTQLSDSIPREKGPNALIEKEFPRGHLLWSTLERCMSHGAGMSDKISSKKSLKRKSLNRLSPNSTTFTLKSTKTSL
jgi:hypothetical protein